MAYGNLKVGDLIYEDSGSDITVSLSGLATKASPTFTGTVTVPTATAGDNSTKAASTAFVVASFAPKAAPAFTGTATGVNLTLSGDLTVQGTTTTIDTTTLQVEDKNIEIGKVSTPSDTTADGGGWTLKGATDKTFNWVNATDAWTSSEHIALAAGKSFQGNLTGNVTGNTSGSAGSCTGNAATATTATTSTNVTVADESSDTSCNVLFTTAATGDLPPKSGTNLTFNSSTGDLTATILTDGKGNIRSIPQNTQGSTYTLVAADAGKHILASGTITVPNSVFSAGDAVTIVNNTAGDLTITKTITTMYLGTDATSANRTLSTRGVATILFASGTVAYISGAGLS